MHLQTSFNIANRLDMTDISNGTVARSGHRVKIGDAMKYLIPDFRLILSCLCVTCILCVSPGFAQRNPSNEYRQTQMMPNEFKVIVIVHGAFGGRHQWKKVAVDLGHQLKVPVHRASLTGQGEKSHLASKSINLDTHIADVVNLIEFEDLSSVCLIGHSYGGVLLGGVSDAIPERISRRIYLDAYLPDDGENFFSHHPELEKKWTRRAKEAGDGWLVPVDWPNPMRDVPHPLATLKQPVKLPNRLADKIPSEYWLFTDGGDLKSDHLKCYYDRAQQRGWSTRSFLWDHNPHRNSPAELVRELVKSLTVQKQQESSK